MIPLSAEAVLLSALLNTADVGAAASYGISPVHFLGYRDEYLWLLNYRETYGTEPSRDAFAVSFPEFTFSAHEDVRSAVDMVFKAYGKRQLHKAMTEAVELIDLGDLTHAHTLLVNAKPNTTAPPPRKLLTDTGFLDTWTDSVDYIEVPYRTLQRFTGGIRPGNLWYLAARPGQGKSAHLASLALHAVCTGARVLFYSLEMSEAEVRGRFHAALARKLGADPSITLSAIRDRTVDPLVYKTFVQTVGDYLAAQGGSLEIHTPADGVVSPATVAARAGEYELSVVDYVGLMRTDAGQAAVEDWRVAAQISNALKEIALASNTALLCAAQINREGEHSQHPPKMKNLSQTDALGQDGDVVLTMRAKSGVATHFSLEKNRHGLSGMPFFTTFSPNVGDYQEITADQADLLAMEADERMGGY